jgi:hypothetical protein
MAFEGETMNLPPLISKKEMAFEGETMNLPPLIPKNKISLRPLAFHTVQYISHGFYMNDTQSVNKNTRYFPQCSDRNL